MSRTYRIFHLIKGFGRGGAERLLTQGLRYADRGKFEYGYGYFLPWKNALVPDLQQRGAEVTCFSCTHPVSILLSVRRLAKFFQEYRIDLVHCHLPIAGVAGRLAARMANLPLVYTEHNLMERYRPLTRQLNRWTWNWQTSVIAVSHKVASSISSHLTSNVPVQVIQNGVDVEPLIPSVQDRFLIRQQFNIPAQSPVVGAVAAFRKGKNLADWIQAARIIKDRLPECHFLLVGDGPLRAQLQNQVNRYKLADSFHIAGSQENVFPFYSAMDVFLISSIFEGLPLALLEAMGMYLPVVATRVGGIPEVIADGESGFLVDARSPQFLAEKVHHLLTREGLRKEFGGHARSVVEKRFSTGRMVKDLEQVYLEILENPSTSYRRGEAEKLFEHPRSTIVH